ncbi:Beta-barrel assembly-enhancing protease [subsurface metagenome]|nr:tetratricopeptide repeat protein [Dehalococcoidia bacterium]
MTNSQTIGSRFENATLELFKRLFPLMGFDLIEETIRCSGSQSGFDIFFKARPASTTDINVNFFVECKSARSVNVLNPHEFEGKPEQLNKSLFNPDYWILFSPLRYLGNDLQELLNQYCGQYPFAFVNWAREGKFEDKAGLYLDLFKHFPEIYNLFKADVPDNIRGIPAEYLLEDILVHLRNSIRHAYDEFQERVVHKGILPGVRRITPHSIQNSRETDNNKLAKIRENYFKLNSSDRYIWKVVCNDIDVRNERLDSQINSTFNEVDSGIASIWILGAPGCGKTTQMNRTAMDFALKGFPVILINTLNLDENSRIVDYEDYFKKIYHLHNAGLDSSDYKTLLIFIDNPTAKLEHIGNLLRHFDDYYQNFRCVFLLFEREIRRREAEEEDYLLDLAERGSLKIYIDNRDMIFKERVCRSFIQALELTGIDRDLAREAYFEKPDISLAEAVINFCKKTSSSRYRGFIMDWVDFDNVIHTLQLRSLSDMYKWVSIIYQLGLVMPVSLLKKVMTNFDESEYYNFQDFFNSAEYENLPLILEGNIVRTRHELLAEWYIEEKLKPTIHQRLVTLLNAIDVDDTYESSIFNSLLRRKSIVKKYFTSLNKNELEYIQQKAARHSATKRNVMMMVGWIEYLKGDFAVAKNIFKSVMDSHPTFLPAILETGKMEFLLGKYPEAEKVLNELLKLEPEDLHARTELARVYQAQEKYPEAEKVLNDLLKLDPNSLQARNELARVYIAIGLFRHAKEIILTYVRTNQCQFDKVDEYLILTYLNACFQMGRYQEGVEFVDELGCRLFSPQLAEEYGRLLRSYDLTSAVTFFEKASEKFNRSGRLLSEVAVCFKLARRPDAKDFLEKAIRLNPYKEEKYWTFFNNPPIKKPLYLRNKDCIGHITDIDYENENGIIKSQSATYRFRSSKSTKGLFRKLKIGDQVFFDITERDYAVNVEPYFSSSVK